MRSPGGSSASESLTPRPRHPERSAPPRSEEGRAHHLEDRTPPDGTLDQLPLTSEIGTIRVGGIDLNRPRMRSAMAAVLALSGAPEGFTVGELAARVQAMTGQAEGDYTVRQAAYDLRNFRGKHLVLKPGRSRRYSVPSEAARTMTALLVLREHVLGPIIAGCRVPMRGRRPNTWTAVDQRYEAIRRDMLALFDDLGITTRAAAA